MKNIEMFSGSPTEMVSGSPTDIFSGSPTEIFSGSPTDISSVLSLFRQIHQSSGPWTNISRTKEVEGSGIPTILTRHASINQKTSEGEKQA